MRSDVERCGWRHAVVPAAMLLILQVAGAQPAAALDPGGAPAPDVEAADTVDPGIAAADTADRSAERPAWIVRLSHSEEWSDGSAQERGLTRVALTRPIGRGAVIGEVLRLREPTGSGLGAGVEVYAPLWRLAEGYARVAGSADALSLPGVLVGVEVVQHLPTGGWHGSVAGEFRRYDQLDVQRYLVGAGWSTESWFVRARAGVIEGGETLPTAHMIVRRTFQAGRGHVEAAASAGGDILDTLEGPDGQRILTATTRSLTAAAQVAVARHLAIRGELGVSAFGGLGRRTHLDLGVVLRH